MNLKSFQVGERMEVLGGWQTWRGRESSTTLPYILYRFLWLFIYGLCDGLYDKLVNASTCFPEFVSHYSKLPKLRRGLWEQVTKVQVGTWSLRLAYEVGGQSLGMEPFACGICANSGQLVSDSS